MARHGLMRRLAAAIVASSGLGSPDAGPRWLPVWLPKSQPQPGAKAWGYCRLVPDHETAPCSQRTVLSANCMPCCQRTVWSGVGILYAGCMLLARAVESRYRDTVAARRVTVVTGPRQSGKTTLVRAQLGDGTFRSLDDQTTLNAAAAEPMGSPRRPHLARHPGIRRRGGWPPVRIWLDRPSGRPRCARAPAAAARWQSGRARRRWGPAMALAQQPELRACVMVWAWVRICGLPTTGWA